jgi:hypothetical protein
VIAISIANVKVVVDILLHHLLQIEEIAAKSAVIVEEEV